EDVHDLRSIQTEFPAISFNDEVSSPEPTVSYFDDLDFFKDFENEFPAIVYNDAKDFKNEFPAIVYNNAQTSKSDILTELILSPQHIDELDLKEETSLSECHEEEQNVLNFNDLFPFNVIFPNDSKSDKDNDDDKVDIDHSSGDLSVKPLPDLINNYVGANAHESNKLLKTSHDTSNKFFKTEMGLNFNVMTCNYLNKGMSFIFLIKNLYVPFGIPFDPKLFYKDGIKLGQIVYTAYPNPMDTAYSLFGRYTVYTAYSLNEYGVYRFQYDDLENEKSMNIGGEFQNLEEPEVLES
ncbi:hypothetical protein Tco_1188348, partial [Tanacetum coccineum]